MVIIMKYKKDKTKLLQIRVSEDELLLLDTIASKKKRTRSDIIRMLIVNGGMSDGKETKKVAI